MVADILELDQHEISTVSGGITFFIYVVPVVLCLTVFRQLTVRRRQTLSRVAGRIVGAGVITGSVVAAVYCFCL